MDKIISQATKLDPTEIVISVYDTKEGLTHLIPPTKHAISSIGNMTEALIGLAFAIICRDDKTILDKPVKDYIPQMLSSKVRVRHLLSMTSTMPSDEVNEREFYKMKDIVYYTSQRERTNVPGRVWEYNHYAINMLPAVFKKIKKRTIESYLDRALFTPYQIKYKWKKDPSGNLYANGFSTNSTGLIQICRFITRNNYHRELMKTSKNPRFSCFCWWIDINRKFIYTTSNDRYLIIIPRKKIFIYYRGSANNKKLLKFVSLLTG